MSNKEYIQKMSQKLFPILADPNAPSSFDGLDVSLSAGQITALNGADSFNMTASTLTANGVSASWADIVDGVVNPPATPNLQAVLNAGNSAEGKSITLQTASPSSSTDRSSMNYYGFQVTNPLSGADAVVNTTYFNINDGTNTQGTLRADSVSVGYYGNQSGGATMMTMTGSTGVIASDTGITLDAVNDVVLSAGADSLTLSSGAMLSASAGGSTDQYLVVTINGTAYRISLLAPPAP